MRCFLVGLSKKLDFARNVYGNKIVIKQHVVERIFCPRIDQVPFFWRCPKACRGRCCRRAGSRESSEGLGKGVRSVYASRRIRVAGFCLAGQQIAPDPDGSCRVRSYRSGSCRSRKSSSTWTWTRTSFMRGSASETCLPVALIDFGSSIQMKSMVGFDLAMRRRVRVMGRNEGLCQQTSFDRLIRWPRRNEEI